MHTSFLLPCLYLNFTGLNFFAIPLTKLVDFLFYSRIECHMQVDKVEEKLKIISIKTQLFIVCIPLIGFAVIIFICMYNFYQVTTSTSKTMRFLWIILPSAFLIWIPAALAISLLVFPKIDNDTTKLVINLSTALVANFLVALIFIVIESKILKNLLSKQ